jgi:hypothetical protein
VAAEAEEGQEEVTPAELLVNLSACVETTLAEKSRPTLCFNGPIPGDGVTSDWFGECEDGGPCGMGWVRLITAYPSTTVGQANTATGNCGKGLGLDIEVGILRCTSVSLPEDVEVEENEALERTEEVLADMLALREAITCCSDLPSSDFILGAWSPMGPLGGLVGGVWTLYAGLL